MTATAAPKLGVQEVRLYERDVRFRMPFRFGVATMTESPQAFARVRVRLADGREGWGMAAEMLAAKWFDKNTDLSNEQNYAQLRRALDIAAALYRDAGLHSAFGLAAAVHAEQVARCAAHDLNPLIAGYGPALLDRAVLDALCRILGVSFDQAMRRNLAGIDAALTPDLATFDLAGFLQGLAPATTIHARHTVGLVDPIRETTEPVGDGLPETLAQVIAAYGQRYFKVKVAGDLEADLDRLTEIAGVLDAIGDDYRVTLDGNEQYPDVAGIAGLWQAIERTPALRRFAGSVLFVEQPVTRARALEAEVRALSMRVPVIIDESDATLDSFPTARRLGYQGVSSKTCKGFYKSILNMARCRAWNAETGGDRFFMSAEDLTTQPGISVQQDLALVGLLGIRHVERNGHHYVNGMTGVPETEQQAFLDAHPDLYHRAGGVARLTIGDGRISLRSLSCPGFAVAAEPDWRTLAPMALPPGWAGDSSRGRSGGAPVQ